MRFDARDEIGAGDEAGIQSGAGQSAGDFQVRRGDERDAKSGEFHAFKGIFAKGLAAFKGLCAECKKLSNKIRECVSYAV